MCSCAFLLLLQIFDKDIILLPPETPERQLTPEPDQHPETENEVKQSLNFLTGHF